MEPKRPSAKRRRPVKKAKVVRYPSKTPGKKARSTKLEAARILDFVEQSLVKRISERQIALLVGETFSIGRLQVAKYVKQVREKWAAEADGTKREDRRNHMRRSLEGAVHTALAKPDPDVSAATRASKLLMDLDALALAPAKQSVIVSGAIGVVDSGSTGKSRAALEGWLLGSLAKPPETK